MPVRSSAGYDGYFHTSPECWQVFTEVLASEYSNAVLFGRIHQLTVDTYAVQHAGGRHPDKSVGIHFAGLYLMLAQGASPTDVPRLHQRLAERVDQWPHFEPPSRKVALTILDIALSATAEDHVRLVRDWAHEVWDAWAQHHSEIEDLVAEKLTSTN